jgi:hypothetical protein
MLDYGVLRNELTADPQALGYGAIVANWLLDATKDQQLADRLNDVTKRNETRVIVPSWEIVNCFDPTEFAALTQLKQSQLTTLLSGGFVNMQNANVRAIATAIFPQGGPTRAALAALQTRARSRAQELFGELVYAGHIANARAQG